ncbi:ATP-binding cassette domain-containing protein [Kribbella sp. NPDC051770]|uniref:ABC transporter ATP-binding protein n=1 Tax=Kribbella sp. NPDC051770 TaxID=3155413 RepID=UPI00342D9E2B
MLIVKDLWYRYADEWVVRGTSLSVEPGEVVGLFGPSGCGKSTIGKLLAGFLKPQRGEILLDPYTGAHPVQLVLQHPERAMNPHWPVHRILAEPGTGPVAKGPAAPGPGADAPDLLSAGTATADLVDPSWLTRFPHEISGGELQRVNLARALLARPRYLIADEITASLDALTQARIWRILLEHARTHEIGVIAISHDPDLLAAVTERTIEL